MRTKNRIVLGGTRAMIWSAGRSKALEVAALLLGLLGLTVGCAAAWFSWLTAASCAGWR
jgi:hypothetical protein